MPSNDYHTLLHYYVSVQPYVHPSLNQEKNYHFIHKNPRKKSSHLTSSCPIVGTVVGNHLEEPHYIVGQTPLERNTGTKYVPERRASDQFF